MRHGLTQPSRPHSDFIRKVQEYDAQRSVHQTVPSPTMTNQHPENGLSHSRIQTDTKSNTQRTILLVSVNPNSIKNRRTPISASQNT